MNEQEKLKNREGKRQWDFLPWETLEECVKVMESGVRDNGYEPHSWKLVPNGELEYKRAALRHTTAIMNNEWLDPKSGLPHAAHAACCWLICMWHRKNNEVKKNEKAK